MTQPNILFVFADQLRSHNLGCYGDTQVSTPNIDRLATEGLKLTNAISTHPVCGPFRGMLMTGNFPIKNGLLLTDHFLRNPDPYFGEVCRDHGYKTGYIGKWHLDGAGRECYIPPERRLGFDFWRTLECTHNYFDSKYYQGDEESPRVWKGYDALAQTDEACSFIEKQDDPFCLFLSWGPPHDPYIAPEKYMERWEEREIHLRENVNDFNTNDRLWQQSDTLLPDRFLKSRQGARRIQEDKSNVTYLQRTRGYLAAIEALDDCMGRLLKSLEARGILDQTIFVFTSDHGDNLGSHRQSAKQLPFEEAISIPFLVRYPEKLGKGRVLDTLFRPVDIMPTLLGLAGISCHSVDGQAVGLEEDNQRPGLDGVLIQKCLALSTNWTTNGNGPWAGVRTQTHTYARLTNSGKPWLFFDNRNDPFQMNNLIGNPAFRELQEKLDRRTSELLEEAGEPEDPKLYAEIILKECASHPTNSRGPELTPTVV